MSLPGWIFYAENERPQVGDLFVVEKIEENVYDVSQGERVTYVTMRRFVRSGLSVHIFPIEKLLDEPLRDEPDS